MKRIIGLIGVLLGILFLIKPGFDVLQLLEALSYLSVRYWPILLIVFGVYLQVDNKKKKRR